MVAQYAPPVADYRLLLETFGIDEVLKLEAFADYDFETLMTMLEAGGTFSKEVLQPTNGPADQEGLKFDPSDGSVTTPKGFPQMYKDYCALGYPALTHNPAFGGSGAPHLMGAVLNEFFTAGNKSFVMCPGLTHGLVEALASYGSDELKKTYQEKLVTGEWTGTMCLTEPQCGTDLGLVSTKAIPEGDHHKLTGTKIWISFGEHDMADNIIHLVLARLPDAPEGIKGISVFVVPKILPDGTHNGIHCGGLEHKLGIHASPTCVMNLEDAVGYMVGEPHKGMRPMFKMMNAARLFVGIEGVSLAEIAYQQAVAFAKDRRQSRALDASKQDKDAKADTILVHPDVRRMLMNVRASNEGMRALSTWVSTMLDLGGRHNPDDESRTKYDGLLALLTPVIKSFCTDRGFLNISECMQVMAGAGYTQDWPVEQYLRDMRIAPIYEGTNHIQALDLVGRKLPRHYGTWTAHLDAFKEANKDHPALKEVWADFEKATNLLHEATTTLGGKAMKDPEEVGAGASNYLDLFGLTAIAYCWAEVLVHIHGNDGPGMDTKRKVGTYYFKQILPEMDSVLAVMKQGKAHMMSFEPDEF